MDFSRLSSSSLNTRNQANEISTSRNYQILADDEIVSKSLKSKIKNLLHTLSSPFRALTRQHVQSKLTSQHMLTGMRNIKCATSLASAIKPMTVQSDMSDTVVTGSGGYHKFNPPPTNFEWV